MRVAIIVPPALKTASIPVEMVLSGLVLDRLNKKIKYDIFDLNFKYRSDFNGKLLRILYLFLNSNKKFEDKILLHLCSDECSLINKVIKKFIGHMDFSVYDLIVVAALEREHVKLGLCFAKFIKTSTGKPLVFGSICDEVAYDIYRSSHLIEGFNFIDYLIDKTRGYDIFLNFLNNYEKNVEVVRGLIYRKDGRIIYNKGYQRENKNSFFYNFNELEPSLNVGKKIMRHWGYIIYCVGRGCKNSCFFCHMNYFPYIMKSPEKVVNDIKKLIDRYGVRSFGLGCSSINCDKVWLLEFLNEIKKKKLDFYWGTMAIPKNLDFSTLKKMADCGCVKLHFGFESRFPYRLSELSKGISADETEEVLINCNKVGICARALFIVGFPHEAKQEIDMLEDFIRKNHKRFTSIDIQTFKLKVNSPLFCDKNKIKKLRIIPRKPDMFAFNYIPYDEIGGMCWEEKLKDNFKKRDRLLALCKKLKIKRASIKALNAAKGNLFSNKKANKL